MKKFVVGIIGGCLLAAGAGQADERAPSHDELTYGPESGATVLFQKRSHRHRLQEIFGQIGKRNHAVKPNSPFVVKEPE
jgi:hypothetical protein